MPKIIYQYAMVANIKYAQLCVFSKKSAAQRSTVNLILVNLCRACQGWAWPYSEQLFVFIPRSPNPGPRTPAETRTPNPESRRSAAPETRTIYPRDAACCASAVIQAQKKGRDPKIPTPKARCVATYWYSLTTCSPTM
jgi:hypothetical protein